MTENHPVDEPATITSADWEHHWNTICLGIVTIAAAVVGATILPRI